MPKDQDVWSCQIGWANTRPDDEYHAFDVPMRTGVHRAFVETFGHEPEFIFSGWGDELSESRLAVVEDREPTPTLPAESVTEVAYFDSIEWQPSLGLDQSRDFDTVDEFLEYARKVHEHQPETPIRITLVLH